MKNVIFAAVALVLSWHSSAVAQLWIDPYVTKDRVQVQGTNGAPQTELPKTIWACPGDANPATGKEAPAEPGRYFQRYESRNPTGSSEYYKGPYPYRYNPYQFRW